ILGVNCPDGVVLVGDRKVIYRENTEVSWQQKLFGFPPENYYPIVIGSAGSVFLGQRFRDDAFDIAQKYQGNIVLSTYMDEISDKIRQYYTLYRSTVNPWDFRILLAWNGGSRGRHSPIHDYRQRLRRHCRGQVAPAVDKTCNP